MLTKEQQFDITEMTASLTVTYNNDMIVIYPIHSFIH